MLFASNLAKFWLAHFLLPLASFHSSVSANFDERSFEIDRKANLFLKDGKPFRYIAGDIHYFRISASSPIPLCLLHLLLIPILPFHIHPSLWQDRLHRVRAAGLNAVQVYVPWFLHEPTPGNFTFDGEKDLVKFLRLAQQNDLFVLLRPGPYVGSELNFGGFPWWLIKDGQSIVLRASNEVFLKRLTAFYRVLLPMLRPLLYQNGGPILMVQVENEYGSIRPACDKAYLAYLRDLFHAHLGQEVVLYTSDGHSNHFLSCGTVEGVFPTINFGSAYPFAALTPEAAESHFELQRNYSGGGPAVNSEFYTMWLSAWTDDGFYPQQIGPILDAMDIFWAQNASFSFYMFHGGTNFGNLVGRFDAEPLMTSYDYSAPLSEAGDITPLYEAIREWIGQRKDWPNPPLPLPANRSGIPIGPVPALKLASLFDIFKSSSSQCLSSSTPLNVEHFAQDHALILYSSQLDASGSLLTIPAFEDYAYVFLDGQYKGNLTVCDNTGCARNLTLHGREGQKLEILVENVGRHTYPLTKLNPKGILSAVLLDGRPIGQQWLQCVLDINSLNAAAVAQFEACAISTAPGAEQSSKGPSIYVAKFDSPPGTDWSIGHTFWDSSGWGHGIALVNGFNLGRYWPLIGPQRTLFVPGAVLKEEDNFVVLLELIGPETADLPVQFLAKPIIKHIQERRDEDQATNCCHFGLAH